MISKRERALKRIEEEKKLIEQNERKISSLDAAIEQEEKEKEKLQSEIDVQQNETKILSAVRRKTTRENRTFSFRFVFQFVEDSDRFNSIEEFIENFEFLFEISDVRKISFFFGFFSKEKEFYDF